MKGTLRQRGPDRWQLQVDLGRDPITGRRRTRSTTITAPHTRAGRKTAEHELARLVLTATAHQAPTGTMTVDQLLDRWIEHRGPDWSPTTLAGVRQRRTHTTPIAAMPVATVRPLDLDNLYISLRPTLAPATIRKVHAMLRTAFAQAVRWQIIPTNPAEHARPPVAARPDITPPTKIDVERILATIDRADWHAYVLVAATTGARRSQMLALRWTDIDLHTNQITFARGLVRGDGGLVEKATKTGAVYTVAIGPRVVAALTRLRTADRATGLAVGRPGASGLVWHTDAAGARPWHPTSISRKWAATAKACGVTGVRLHDLRHHVATELLAAGVDPVTVAHRLGHANPSVTLSTYAAWVPARDQAAADLIEARPATP